MADYLLRLIKDFGFSDKIETMHTDQSWVLGNVSITASKMLSYLLSNNSVSIPEYAANVFNGLTPTGTQWAIDYPIGYLWFSGQFITYEAWSSMYVGCTGENGVLYYHVNQQASLRTGGHESHTGEYIHSNCNAYGSQDNSITSRVDWQNTRVFWGRIKF